jgi:hypothetical protein
MVSASGNDGGRAVSVSGLNLSAVTAGAVDGCGWERMMNPGTPPTADGGGAFVFLGLGGVTSPALSSFWLAWVWPDPVG